MTSAELTNQINEELQEKYDAVVAGIEEYKRLAIRHAELLAEYRANALIVLAALKDVSKEQEQVIVTIENMSKVAA